MSDTILSSDLTVYYLAENRRKQIKWTGGTLKTNTRRMIEVYDAAEDLVTAAAQMDDGLIFSAETPGEYTIGKIDAGETDPWFIDLLTMEHIVGDFANFTGCALKTSGWTRVQDSNTGIVVVPITKAGSTIVAGDIGFDITHGDGDSGVLLDLIVAASGTEDYLWIRPDSDASTNNFDTGSGTLTCNAHTATQQAAAHTGEMVWGNIYTQGALQTDTHIFVFQNGERVTRVDSITEDWWPDGQVQRAIPITDYKTTAFPLIDAGFLTVKANRYGTGYTYAVIRMNTTSGGNVSAPLSSGVDGGNLTGYASILLGGDSGNFAIGDEISGDSSGARGIITLITGTTPARTLHYFQVGDPIIAFNGTEAISNEDDSGAATGSGAPANQGPALASWFSGSVAPTVAFGFVNADVNDDAVNETYGIDIDLNQATFAQMYEWQKYIKRRGSTFDLDGLDGQEWIGIDYAVIYTGAITGTVSEGATVTGVTSGATGVVVSHDTGATFKVLLLRNSRGTFVDAEQIQVDGGNFVPASGTTVDVITPVAASSFGTLAGGTFFGSRGVLVSDYIAGEANSFTLIDALGNPRAQPTSITMTVLGLLVNDWVSCHRLTGAAGPVDKAEYSATGGETAGAATLTVDTAIAADVPGKTLGGRVVLVDVDDNDKEYVFRYSSYAAATGVVTLANTGTQAATAGTTDVELFSTGNLTAADVQVGDLIWNSTRSAYAYVLRRVSDNQVTLDRPIASQVSTDSFEINAIPNITVNTADTVYFPIILQFIASGTSKQVSMQYVADIEARVKVRNTSDAAIKIKGFTSDLTITTGGGSATAVRTPNTVYGS